MIFIEFFLSIIVLIRGWRWLTIIPAGGCYILGVLTNIYLGILGIHIDGFWYVLFDLAAIKILIIMAFIKPKW